MDWKLEAVVIRSADVDRTKRFYADTLGFPVDVDHVASDTFRVVQVTPPGSSCSFVFGIGLGDPDRGPVTGTTLVVADIEAALEHLDASGVEHGGIVHFDGGTMVPGPHPKREAFGSFIHFADPDGNSWSVQERPDGS